jgi:hypothetical protein
MTPSQKILKYQLKNPKKRIELTKIEKNLEKPVKTG